MTSSSYLPAKHDLYLYRGDSVDINFRFGSATDTDTPVFDEAYDLTGVDVAAQIRAKQDATTVLAEFAVVVADQADADTRGKLTISLETGDTDNLPSRAYWDLQFTYPNGDVQTRLGGQVYTSKDTTRE